MAMLSLCQYHVAKTRRRKGRWEIDEFETPKGLWLAEIELKNDGEYIDLPPWIGKEVTYDPQYANSQIAEHATIVRIALDFRKKTGRLSA